MTFDDDGNEVIPDGAGVARSRDIEASSELTAAEIDKLKKDKEELHKRRLAAEKW